MKQYEAVIKVMEENGGFATLGQLYRGAAKVRGANWGTKTPDASIRRIVQEHEDKFFKIRPGLWALVDWKGKLPDELRERKAQGAKARKKRELFDHSYYEGLILEIGNLQRFGTYVVARDRNQLFLGRKPLGSIATCSTLYPFAYGSLLNSAKYVDVIWFNSRRMPAAFFEVEHTTDMTRAMVKFNELRDFRSAMYVVARDSKEKKFKHVTSLDTFKTVNHYVQFLSYDRVQKDHSRVCALETFGPGIEGLYASN